MKRVLIISYYWPPSGGSGVQRWVKFAKYLPEYGWQPVIYTPENPDIALSDNTLEAEIPACAEIIRRPIFEPYGIYRKLFGRAGGGKGVAGGGADGGGSVGSGVVGSGGVVGGGVGGVGGGGGGVVVGGPVAGASGARPAEGVRSVQGARSEVNPINAQKKSFAQKLSLYIRGNFFIPDPRCLWVRPSVKYLKKYLKEHPVDVIVSTGPPHSMHLIARKLSLATGIPWVADFRDPWTKMFYFKHLHLTARSERRHLKLEKQVLDDATRIVAVSPLVQDDFRTMTSTPVELITNGFDEEDFDRPVEEGFDRSTEEVFERQAESDRYFNIVHTGLFAADGNPEVLWQVLAEKCAADPQFKAKLRIRLVGKTDREIVSAIQEAGLGENLVDLGYQPHNVAVREQKAATMLILPLRKEPEYRAVLPGKLFEYLASARPVLGIGQKDGAMARILSETKAGEVHDWTDAQALASFVDQVWKATTSAAGGKEASPADKGQSVPDRASAPDRAAGADPETIRRYSRRALTQKMAALLDKITTPPENRLSCRAPKSTNISTFRKK